MEYIGYDEEYQLPKTAQEAVEELDYLFFPNGRKAGEQEETAQRGINEITRNLILQKGGDVDDYDRAYNRYLFEQMQNDQADFIAMREAQLDYYQDMVDLRLDLCEIDETYNVRDNPEIVAAVEEEVRKSLNDTYKNNAALNACWDYETEKKDRGEVAEASLYDIQKQSDIEDMEEQKQQMIKRFEAMSHTDELEYVVRGAPIMCMAGSHSRHLDMYRSHGIYVNNKAVAFEEDCIVDKNISYFGHCYSPACTLTERISLKVGQVVNSVGVALQDVEESIYEGIKCVPKFDGKWQNTHLTTLIAKDGGAEIFGDGYSPYCRAVTTASYLICEHGGLVYPLTSGQIDEAYYHAAFQNYPFQDFGSEAFYKWCEENDVCPVIAGKPGHSQWHQKKIEEALADFKQAKENYEAKYPENRIEKNLYSSPLDSLNATNAYEEYSDYEAARANGQAAYENCLLEAKRVGAANMSSEEAGEYGDILQDYLNSGLLREQEKKEAVSQYGEFLRGYRGSRGAIE